MPGLFCWSYGFFRRIFLDYSIGPSLGSSRSFLAFDLNSSYVCRDSYVDRTCSNRTPDLWSSSEVVLRIFWIYSGHYWENNVPFWGYFIIFWELSEGILILFWNSFEVLLRFYWSIFGVLLNMFWVFFGTSGILWGSSGDFREIILSFFVAILGISWGYFGSMLGFSGLPRVLCWSSGSFRATFSGFTSPFLRLFWGCSLNLLETFSGFIVHFLVYYPSFL